MRQKIFMFVVGLSICFLPILVTADMGAVYWPALIHLNQTDQNAIVAWNGTDEILILSTNWQKEASISEQTTSSVLMLEVLPLPQEPSEVKEASEEIFSNLVGLINSKIRNRQALKGGQPLSPASGIEEGIEIVFEKVIGAHDITIVKVNNEAIFLNWIDNFTKEKGLSAKQISFDFIDGVSNYLKRHINYFVFDVIEITEQKQTKKPLLYRFKTDELYFPMLISGISEIQESFSKISLFLITQQVRRFSQMHKMWSQTGYGWDWGSDFEVLVGKQELTNRVSQDLADLFEGDVLIKRVQFSGKLKDIKKDFVLLKEFEKESLRLGQSNEEVRALQKLLINEGCWDSGYEATGYFGQVTKASLIKFQEKYKAEILTPLGLSKGTGFFGSSTRKFVNGSLGLF